MEDTGLGHHTQLVSAVVTRDQSVEAAVEVERSTWDWARDCEDGRTDCILSWVCSSLMMKHGDDGSQAVEEAR